MPIGNPNGIGLAYDLSEVAKLLGHQDIRCESGQAFMQQLGDYFRQHNLIEMFNAGGGWDRVTLGSVRAFCIDHGVSIPETIAGPISPQEIGATLRKMQGSVGVVQIASIPDHPTEIPVRKHGGSRPESIFIEEYVRRGFENDRTPESLRRELVRHINEQIAERNPDCPFIKFDAVNKKFSVEDAKGRTRWCSVESLNRSVMADGKKKEKRLQPCASVASRSTSGEM